MICRPALSRTVLALALAVGLATAAAAQPTLREVRGVWIPAPVHTSLWSSKATLAEQMNYYASRGFNVVFPVVWVDGYTLYPSQVMQDRFGVAVSPALAASRRNMLDELIVEARRVGLEVIPWFEYGFATHYGDSGGHILQARPDWAARDRMGNLAMQYRDPGTGTGFTWMNGINPEVQDFMLDLVREISETYDVDGIQGDDRLPAMPAVAGYDAYTVGLYRAEHGGQDPPADATDPAFIQWKSNKLTAFGRRLYDTVKAVDESLIVSLSPSIFPFSRDNYLQDWPAWLAAGQVDLIHPQAYRYSISGYKQLVVGMVGPTPNSTGGYVRPEHRHKLSPGIVALVGSQRNGPNYLREAVRFNREFGINGEVFFFNEGLRSRNEFAADTLFRYHYSTPALLPGRVGPRRPAAILLGPDSPGVTFTGPWTVASPTVPGFAGPMRVANAGTGAVATYSLEVVEAGVYDVYAYQPTGFATRTAHYTLAAPGGTTVVRVDQLGNTNVSWTKIGSVRLAPGAPGLLTVSPDLVTDPEPQLRRTFAEGVMLQLNRRLSRQLVSSESGPPAVSRGTLALGPPAPNPTRGDAALPFTLAAPADVSAQVFDLLGRRVATVPAAAFGAGAHRLGLSLGKLPAGTYLVRVEAAGEVQTGTVTLAR